MNNVESSCGRSRKGFALILVMCGALAGLCLSACATIIHGMRQEVGISSSPTGAEVWVDNVKMGETPVVAKLRRKDTHTVKLLMPGYQAYETTITRSVSGWVWGNIAIGGLLGLGIRRNLRGHVQAQSRASERQFCGRARCRFVERR